MGRITTWLIIAIILGMVVTIGISISVDFLNGILFFIAYESLLYPVFKGLEDNYKGRKVRKITYVDSEDSLELFECRVNKKLEELNNGNFTIVDVKIVNKQGNEGNGKEAYILYY